MICPTCHQEYFEEEEMRPLTPEEEAEAEEASRKWREAHYGMSVAEILIESLEQPNPFFQYLKSKGMV